MCKSHTAPSVLFSLTLPTPTPHPSSRNGLDTSLSVPCFAKKTSPQDDAQAPRAKAHRPPSEDDGDKRWINSKTLKTTIHSPFCSACRHWHSHYIINAVQDVALLQMAIEGRARALLDFQLDSEPVGIEMLEKERGQAVQELAEVRKQLSEACRKLKQAWQDRDHVVDSNKQKRREITSISRSPSCAVLSRKRADLHTSVQPRQQRPPHWVFQHKHITDVHHAPILLCLASTLRPVVSPPPSVSEFRHQSLSTLGG